MEKRNLTFEILCEAILQMTPGQLMVLRKKYEEISGEDSQIFLEAVEEADLRRRNQVREKEFQWNPQESQLSVSEKYQKRVQFKEKLYQYIEAYKQERKKAGEKVTLTEIYTGAGFDHNSWYRMLDSFGRGRQYHDKLRCICFVLKMKYLAANEFLLFAGQPFDLGSMRDYCISCCLEEGLYSPYKVNKYLESKKQQPLFQWNE